MGLFLGSSKQQYGGSLLWFTHPRHSIISNLGKEQAKIKLQRSDLISKLNCFI
jgi:hypothetical protein